MNTDIESRAEIETLVIAFYDAVKKDEQIGHYFAHVNWSKHLNIMFDFWENILFYSGTYSGNPMKVHQQIHQLKNLSAKDFDHWINLFCLTVDQLFTGENATAIKCRATNIARVMQQKIMPPSGGNNTFNN